MKKLVLENFLPYRLNRLASAVSRDFKAVYGRHYDLTVPEWRVLATLGQFGEMGAKAIGAHSYMHKTKVSRAVRALERRRWLKRREVPEDRREEIFSLTPLGEDAYAEIIPRAIAFEKALVAGLGPEAKALLTVLERPEAHVGVRSSVGNGGTVALHDRSTRAPLPPMLRALRASHPQAAVAPTSRPPMKPT